MTNDLLIEVDGRVQVNPYLRTIDVFKRLIARDRNRFKPTAIKELSWIYFTAHWRSSYLTGFSEKERGPQIQSDLGFTPTWKPDALLEEAVEWFRVQQNTATVKMLTEAQEGCHTAVRMLKMLRNSIERSIEEVDRLVPPPPVTAAEQANMDEAELEEHQMAILTFQQTKDKLVAGAVNSLKELLSLAEKLPSAIKNLSDMEARVIHEMTDSGARGGGKVGEYEDI